MKKRETRSDRPIDHPARQRPWVLFDSACPLCAREIAHYRRIAGSDSVVWIDLSVLDRNVRVDGISHDAAMARFHVRDRQGRWHTGAFGFVELWRHLRYYRAIGGFIRLTRLMGTLDTVYTRFARWRLARRCETSTCAVIGSTPGDTPLHSATKRQSRHSVEPLSSSSLGE